MTINRKQSIIIISVGAALIALFIILSTFIDPIKPSEEPTTDDISVIYEVGSSEVTEEESSEPVATTELITETPTTEKTTVEKTTKKPEPTTKKTVATTAKPVTTEKVESVQNNTYFDVPLSHDLQDHIFNLCDTYGVDPVLVITIIQTESNFQPSAVNYNDTCFGLMQIYQSMHLDRMNRLGVTNLYDPYQNVTVGIDLLGELYSSGRGTNWVLYQYSGGMSSYANTIARRAEAYGGLR